MVRVAEGEVGGLKKNSAWPERRYWQKRPNTRRNLLK